MKPCTSANSLKTSALIALIRPRECASTFLTCHHQHLAFCRKKSCGNSKSQRKKKEVHDISETDRKPINRFSIVSVSFCSREQKLNKSKQMCKRQFLELHGNAFLEEEEEFTQMSQHELKEYKTFLAFAPCPHRQSRVTSHEEGPTSGWQPPPTTWH
jgi:hypothetical protein